MGLGIVRIADPERRDRRLLINAFAVLLLTLLGAVGESLSMDRPSGSTPRDGGPIPCSVKAACSTA
jgi:hypothetical protein